MKTESLVGKTLVCAETGKEFVGQSVGCTTNYAGDAEGHVFSDEGVEIREKRGLLDRTKPFFCYLSSDGKTVTGWKGNILGRVVRSSVGGGFGNSLTHVRIVDVHGNPWHGKGAGGGMCITLHASKS